MRVPSGVSCGVIAVAWCAVACWTGVATPAAEPPRPAAAPWARVGVRGPQGPSVVEGAVVVASHDGGLLLERIDQRYELLQPAEVVSRELFPAPPREEPRELATRILADLPAGFDVHVTKHYVICFNTSRDYAKWAGGLFERLHDAFLTYWRRVGLDVTEPDRPLVVVIYADRRDYEECVTRDVGVGADRVSGYYSFLTNRVTTYDLTAADGGPRSGRGPGKLAAEVLARPEAAGLVATLVHEATHQMAFNCGMHRRLSPVPLWVAEGVANCFETPDMRAQAGWRGIAMFNASRLRGFRQTYQPGDLARIVVDDTRFRDVETAESAYAAAWALTWFLMETRRDAFVKYLAALGTRGPCSQYDRDERLRDFEAAFGSTEDLEPAFLRHMTRAERRVP